MLVPENLHERPYYEWNYMVRGLVEVWELGRKFGMERELEALIADDRDGRICEDLARVGNGFCSLAQLLLLLATVVEPEERVLSSLSLEELLHELSAPPRRLQQAEVAELAAA